MERRKFTREFKLEAVKLVRERGVTVAEAARDLGVPWYRVTPMGTGGGRRCATGLPRSGADEARISWKSNASDAR